MKAGTRGIKAIYKGKDKIEKKAVTKQVIREGESKQQTFLEVITR